MSDLTTWAYRPSFVCWRWDGGDKDDLYDHAHYHPAEVCDWGWVCNSDGCLFRTDEIPCPDHAPMTFPGLRLVECQSEPPHLLFVHDCDDYGHGCPACHAKRLWADLVPLAETAERRAHRWCWVSNRLKRAAIRLRLAQATVYWGSSCRHVDVKWRWFR